MNTHALAGCVVLPMLIGVACGLAGCSGEASAGGVEVTRTRADGTKLSADDRAAADFVRSKLEAHWIKGPDGWTTQYYAINVFGQRMDGVPDVLYRQYREFKFTIEPEELSESQRLNGADYRASVQFETTPERLYRTTESFEGPEGWSPWRDGFPTFMLAVERRNGQWLISDDSLFDGELPNAAEVPSGR